MFPLSVDPRAKMKNTSLQGPFWRSLEVSEVCRTSSWDGAGSVIGVLRTGIAAIVQRIAMRAD